LEATLVRGGASPTSNHIRPTVAYGARARARSLSLSLASPPFAHTRIFSSEPPLATTPMPHNRWCARCSLAFDRKLCHPNPHPHPHPTHTHNTTLKVWL
jgi:hypothetical protein